MKNPYVKRGLFAGIALLLLSCQKQEMLMSTDSTTMLIENQQAEIPMQGTYTAANVADWMGFLPNNTLLSTLTIPGTHDSGARIEPVSGTAKTQNLTIAQQLDAGVRFLDIRCRHYQDAFTIHHGAIYQNLNFDDVINACKNFLQAHPNETIIMSVKPEHTAEGNTRTFQEQFNLYVQQDAALWHLNSGIPTLGDTRGKIVLLRRFGANADWGLNASHSWGDKATFTINNGSYSLRVQDEYQVSNNSNKWNAITNLWNEAISGNNQTMYVNFTSGYQQILWVIPDIPAVSNGINPQVNTFFSNSTGGRYGSVVMDFITTGIASNIVQANF